MKNNIKPLTRDEIVDQVVNLGPLDIGGAMQQGLKVEIQEYFLQNKPSVQNFAEYLNEKYGKLYSPACVFDDNTPFKPYDFISNMAGLQYKYRDDDKIIKLECLQWGMVAKITARQIQSNTYLQKPSILATLNSFAKHSNKSIPQKEQKSLNTER